MTDSDDRQLRITALATAQVTFGSTGTPDLVLAAAEAYFAFLKGDQNA